MKKVILFLSVTSLICFLSFAFANSPTRLIGNINTHKYHRENCRVVKTIKHPIILNSPEGFIPCKVCQPPVKKEN